VAALSVPNRRLTICRTCRYWRGSCGMGHDIQSSKACPVGRFPGYLAMGDVLACVLKPIVTASDLLLKTTLRNCPGCKTRQAGLNHLVRR
jgi:hypothetical protein